MTACPPSPTPALPVIDSGGTDLAAGSDGTDMDGNLMDAVKNSQSAVLLLAIAPLALLNHVTLTFELSDPPTGQAQLRVGFAAGAGF